MATGIVISVAEKLYAILHSEELREICSIFGYESELDDLKMTVFTIKYVLLDAESKQQELTHGGRDYIERLKEAVYDVDDLLDEFNTMVQKEKNKKGGKISKKIKNLRRKLDKIAKDRQQFGFSDVYVPIKRREETMSFASEDNVIGRETDKEAIVRMLIRDSECSNDVDFVTIVGIGGLGKTAVAQLVYNDSRIETTFELRLWVCVSEDFVMERIFQKMLGGKDGTKIEELQREVRKLIQGKRYLLVLDDVWSESRDEWDNLKSFLNLGGTGSRIMVTSRSKKVARVAGDNLMYELKGLSEENSWNLFKRLSFEQGKEPMNSDDLFFDIGKEIVKKCANVPLSIRVVGSMLYDQDESKLLSLKSANLMEIREGDDGIMPILKYSYYHLTPVLKSCFSYCVLFPKDFRIEKELLIRLWFAQGCLENPHDCRSEEDVGEEYFSILLHRCFFQDIQKGFHGEIKFCKMHDLIHDLALEVAGKETIMFDTLVEKFDKKIRHLSFTTKGCPLFETPSTQLSEMKKWRTFLRFNDSKYMSLFESNLATICSHLRRLRVLYLDECISDTLPDKVGNLFHLRYLDLSKNSRLKVLPNSISKLLNLLVLNLDSTGVRELPHDMRKLVNLRHLSLRFCSYLRHMPPSLDTLTSLHMLTTFVAGDETSNQRDIGKLRDLRALVNLRDELIIKFNKKFSCNVAEYEEVELLRSAPLKHLTLKFSDQGAAIHETLLAGLQPHCRLSTISIKLYRGSKLPLWAESLTSSLPHLVSIRLANFDCLAILPSLSQLRHLKFLKLKGISNVHFVESDIFTVPSDNPLFFPSLEKLQLRELPILRGWWREETSRVTGDAGTSSVAVPSFPCLRVLVLRCCPNLTAFPSCPKLISVELFKVHEELTLLGSKTVVPNSPTTGLLLHLNELRIDNVGSLDCLFGESLRSIHCLSIEDFEGENLSGVFKHLTGLQSLSISNCKNIEFEDDEQGVTETSWKSLRLLSSLTLCSLPKLLNMPKEFQYLISLESLKLICCENLEALPEWLNCLTSFFFFFFFFFGNNCLTSLQKLSIEWCRKLKSLPEAISHMPSLKTLNLIRAGEDLKKRCRKPDGEDWPKICHIPHVLL
ncbi:hypothetical protein RND81_09G129800 [Saponaria officinalis]|uniref:Uncharacterized protein n=1 Tax=Saponaria officinalis TaxID=3572 RepID=A0AAW1IM41_SAPOF